MNENICKMCHNKILEPFLEDANRTYHKCAICSLISVPSKYHLSNDIEKQHYDLHENDPSDLNYRKFLSRLFLPLIQKIEPHSFGLDFGCGPGPTLSVMFEECGHIVNLFDLHYYPNSMVFDSQYDFITATEVLEHLKEPWKDLYRLWHCLKEGGYLGIMTKLTTKKEAFDRWHYKQDPTHICFYSTKTFEWLAKQINAKIVLIEKDVIILQKLCNQ